MRTFFFIIHTETFAMFPSTSVAHQTQCNCNKLEDDLVWTKCNPIKATFNMFQCNSNLAGMQPTLLRVVYTTELYQPHLFHMKCVREMSSIPLGQLRKNYRQKRLTKCFHLSIFHDSFLLFIYACYSYTWFHFDTHKKLKKAYPKSVSQHLHFTKNDIRMVDQSVSGPKQPLIESKREPGKWWGNQQIADLFIWISFWFFGDFLRFAFVWKHFIPTQLSASKWEECNDFFPVNLFGLDPTIWPAFECGYGLRINFLGR